MKLKIFAIISLIILVNSAYSSEGKPGVLVISMVNNSFIQKGMQRDWGDTMFGSFFGMKITEETTTAGYQVLKLSTDPDSEIETMLNNAITTKGKYTVNTSAEAVASSKEIKSIARQFRQISPCENKELFNATLDAMRKSGSDVVVFFTQGINSFIFSSGGRVSANGIGMVHFMSEKGNYDAYASGRVCVVDVKEGENVSSSNLRVRKPLELPVGFHQDFKEGKREKDMIIHILNNAYKKEEKKPDQIAEYQPVFKDTVLTKDQKDLIRSKIESEFGDDAEDILSKLYDYLSIPKHRYIDFNQLPKVEQNKIYNQIMSILKPKLGEIVSEEL